MHCRFSQNSVHTDMRKFITITAIALASIFMVAPAMYAAPKPVTEALSYN